MYKLETIKKPPDDIPISPDAEENAMAWIPVLMSGTKYYIPLNMNLKLALKLKERAGKFYCDTYKQYSHIDKALRDILSAINIQVRDTIGANITASLSNEIQEGLQKLYMKQLHTKVMSEFPELPELIRGKED